MVAEQPARSLDLPEDERAESPSARRRTTSSSPSSKQSLHDFGIHFDVWFSERSLHTSGAVTEHIEKLRELRGTSIEQDGALWMRTTDAGDDKDRVLIRSDGEAHLLRGDTAYYLDKRARGFDVCIYLLGADHHGYVGRIEAMCGLRR